MSHQCPYCGPAGREDDPRCIGVKNPTPTELTELGRRVAERYDLQA